MSHTYTQSCFPLRMHRVPPWQAAIILTGALAITLTLAVLAGGLFLLLLPAFAVGFVIYRVSRRYRKHVERPDPDIIEGEYVVIADEPADDRTPPPERVNVG